MCDVEKKLKQKKMKRRGEGGGGGRRRRRGGRGKMSNKRWKNMLRWYTNGVNFTRYSIQYLTSNDYIIPLTCNPASLGFLIIICTHSLPTQCHNAPTLQLPSPSLLCRHIISYNTLRRITLQSLLLLVSNVLNGVEWR